MCDNNSRKLGLGVGMILGAAVGIAVYSRRCAMKTCVGRAMQRMGCAMDNAADGLRHAMK